MGDGWFKGKLGCDSAEYFYGKQTKLLAQLEANKKTPSQQKKSGLMEKLEALQREQERIQQERQNRMRK